MEFGSGYRITVGSLKKGRKEKQLNYNEKKRYDISLFISGASNENGWLPFSIARLEKILYEKKENEGPTACSLPILFSAPKGGSESSLRLYNYHHESSLTSLGRLRHQLEGEHDNRIHGVAWCTTTRRNGARQNLQHMYSCARVKKR